MKKELKIKWLKALRGGQYKQARGTLLSLKSGGMCCLGVLATIQGCDLRALKKTKDISLRTSNLPRGYNAGINYATRGNLAEKNDKRTSSFAQIADYIEKHL